LADSRCEFKSNNILSGIYIHIPFCQQACYYCDFYFSTDHKRINEVVNALGKELHLRKDYISNSEISTIYFGGGTPSVVNADRIRNLVDTIFDNYNVASHPEITLEANPEDINYGDLEKWKNLGINRLSLGVQSFQDDILVFLNRVHSAETAIKALDLIKDSGFDNVNVDLIYGIKMDDHSRWQYDLDGILDFKPSHISAYQLTIEDKTVFGKWFKKGKLEIPDEEFMVAEYEMLVRMLTRAGYIHYEVSNFSKPNCESRHNSAYWKNAGYLGIGPGAHSFNQDSRQFNISNNALYIKALAENKIPAIIEELTDIDKVNDYILTSIRTMWGTSLTVIRENWNYNLMISAGAYLDEIMDIGFCIIENEHIVLTEKGLMIADRIASDLFVSN